MNCAQESELLDDRQPALLPRKRWCFTTNHWKAWHFTSFVWVSWWVLWRPLCGMNHSRKDFAGKLLLAHLLQGCPWLFQELWCMSNLCTKVYCEWPFTSHATFRTFWKMGPSPMTRRGHQFIVIATNYLTKFAKVLALKSSVKHEITWFLYERVFTRFGTPLEIVSDNGPQFLNEVVENLLARLVVKHRFTTMY
jgi:hypothetical protein